MKPRSQIRYKSDILATRTSLGALRTIFTSPYRSLGVPEIARTLGTSRASVHRHIHGLVEEGMVREVVSGRRAFYRVDPASPMAEPLFELFNNDRYQQLDAQLRIHLGALLEDMDLGLFTAIILFGSHARGHATTRSDVDLCLVQRGDRYDPSTLEDHVGRYYAEFRLEPHGYSESAFDTVPDLAALDAILFGISLHGHHYLFKRRSSLQSISKANLLSRLEASRKNLERSHEVIGEARRYFEGIVEVSLAEVESVLSSGTTVSKRDVKARRRFKERISSLEERLAGMGEVIWLG